MSTKLTRISTNSLPEERAFLEARGSARERSARGQRQLFPGYFAEEKHIDLRAPWEQRCAWDTPQMWILTARGLEN
jgi:hypothetical protein